MEYLSLCEALEQTQLQEGIEDRMVRHWTLNDDTYSASSSYKALHLGATQSNDHKLI